MPKSRGQATRARQYRARTIAREQQERSDHREDESYDPLFPDLADCVECGHLHYNSKRQTYVSCPVDGCDCRGQSR